MDKSKLILAVPLAILLGISYNQKQVSANAVTKVNNSQQKVTSVQSKTNIAMNTHELNHSNDSVNKGITLQSARGANNQITTKTAPVKEARSLTVARPKGTEQPNKNTTWYSTRNLKALNKKVVVLKQNRSKSFSKKIFSVNGATPGSNRPVYFKTKYKVNQFTNLSVKQQMNIDNSIYYNFQNSDGKSGWIWHGYTGMPTKYKSVKKYNVKIKHGNSHPFFSHAHYGDYSSKVIHYQKNYINKSMVVTSAARVSGGTYDYLRLSYKGKNMGWILSKATAKVSSSNSNEIELTEDDTPNTINDNVQNLMNKYHLNGRIVLVKNGNATSISNGYANLAQKTLNSDSNVVYASASLQKAMTAAMMVQLITESQKSKTKFNQYTTINRWMPQLKGSNKITLGSLMTQTSGISDPNDEKDPGKVLTEQQAVDSAISRINKIGLTNNKFHYSNSNYILLAGIIRKVTGKSYENNLNSRIIKPLGLKSTFMWDSVPTSKKVASSYKYNNGDYKSAATVRDSLLSLIVGAGNMFTTPEDYHKFEQGLSNGKILNSSDYKYLTNLKTRSTNGYSGGMYVSYNTKTVYGSLASNHLGDWVTLTLDNKNGALAFINQTYDMGSGIKATIKKLTQDCLALL